MQKCVFSLTDANRYWCLHARKKLVRLGAKLSSINPGIFYWQEDSGLIGILACQVNDMIWWGTESFKTNAIDNLKSTFKFCSEEIQTFVYIGIELTQNSNYSICIELYCIYIRNCTTKRKNVRSKYYTDRSRKNTIWTCCWSVKLDCWYIQIRHKLLCLQGQYRVKKCNSSICILRQQNHQKCKEHQKLH